MTNVTRRARRRDPLTLLLCTLVLRMLHAVAGHADCGTLAFTSPTAVAVGNGPNDVATGDFDRDGVLDLAVPNSADDTVSILLGDGVGGFTAAPTVIPHDDPVDLETSDVNLDGKLDLVVANFLSDDVSVLLGNGAGGFGNATNFAAGNQPTAVAVGDFNRDGKPDLAVVRLSGTTISILTGDGTGSFSAPTAVSLAGAFGGRAIHAADLDRNGTLDLVVATANASNQGAVTIFKGNGAGAFAFGSTTTASAQLLEDLIVIDLDRDGIPDVVTANTNNGGISVLVGDGNGGVGAATVFANGIRFIALAAADMDLDGKPDVVAGSGSSSVVSVLLGDGAGVLASPIDFTIGGSSAGPFGVAIGDFDLDGKPDFVSSNRGFDEVAVRLNTCGEPTPTVTPTATLSPTPTATPEVHGFVPPDKVALACADGVAKAAAKAVNGLITCRRKAASKSFKAKPFDQTACETAVLAAYDAGTRGLFARKSCPVCLVTSVADLRQQATRLDGLRDPPYCAGSVPIP